jgi:hypothetical protein
MATDLSLAPAGYRRCSRRALSLSAGVTPSEKPLLAVDVEAVRLYRGSGLGKLSHRKALDVGSELADRP